MEKMLNEYLKTLSPLELKAYHIAKDHLKDSFDLKKSIIQKTQECINNYTEESVNETYHSISEVWG